MSYPAIALIRQFTRKYPDVWELIESFRSSEDKSLPAWDDRCYIPIQKVRSITSQMEGMNELYPALIAALASWRVSKEVYRFAPSLEMRLYDEADHTMTIPADDLDTLPFQCIYIESPQLIDECHGFFAHLDHDPACDQFELRILFVSQNPSLDEGWRPMVLHLGRETIADSLHVLFKGNIQQSSCLIDNFVDNIDNTMRRLNEMLIRSVQLVMYICARNTEIIERKLRAAPRNLKEIEDEEYSKEIRRWDVI